MGQGKIKLIIDKIQIMNLIQKRILGLEFESGAKGVKHNRTRKKFQIRQSNTNSQNNAKLYILGSPHGFSVQYVGLRQERYIQI